MTKHSTAIVLPLFLVLLWLSACNLPMPYSAQTPEASQAPPASPIPGLSPAPATGLPAPTAPPPATDLPTRPAPTAQPASSATPPAPAATLAATPAPESVVVAYLEAYPDDDSAMLATLSQARRKDLPAGGPGRLLQVQGDLQGFAIQSGSEIPDPPQAIIVVALRAGGQDAVRTFNLVRENGAWFIDSITP